MFRRLYLPAFIILFAALAPTPGSQAAESLDPSLFSIGACGSVMTGYDGRPYTCDPDRKAVCEYASKRCVCLERRDCGGTRDEPF